MNKSQKLIISSLIILICCFVSVLWGADTPITLGGTDTTIYIEEQKLYTVTITLKYNRVTEEDLGDLLLRIGKQNAKACKLNASVEELKEGDWFIWPGRKITDD